MNKAGIELAANFIIILIISIVMLGMAGGITYKIMCASENKIEQLDATSERFIQQKLNSGANVQVPVPVKETKTGASFCGEKRSASVSYTIGIRNDQPTQGEFTISCEYKGLETPSGIVATSTVTCSDWRMQASKLTIEPREKKAGLIVLTAPPATKAGRHIFTLTVAGSFENPDDPSGAPITVPKYAAVNIYLGVN